MRSLLRIRRWLKMLHRKRGRKERRVRERRNPRRISDVRPEVPRGGGFSFMLTNLSLARKNLGGREPRNFVEFCDALGLSSQSRSEWRSHFAELRREAGIVWRQTSPKAGASATPKAVAEVYPERHRKDAEILLSIADKAERREGERREPRWTPKGWV